jgi:hypothetical protein
LKSLFDIITPLAHYLSNRVQSSFPNDLYLKLPLIVYIIHSNITSWLL